MTSGVYAIFLTDTPFVYVGESANIEKRWKIHANTWVWPQHAEYVVIREMTNSHEKKRQWTETALHRLLRKRGYLLLSNAVKEREEQLEIRGRAVAVGLARLSSEQRKARSQAGIAAIAALTAEQRHERAKKCWQTRYKNGTAKRKVA